MNDPASHVLALTVNCYWACVLLLAVVRWLRLRQGVGLLPRQHNERLMWPLWVPVIVAWNVLPRVALRNHHFPWGISALALDEPGLRALRVVAAGSAVLCFLLTVHCWLTMGRNWSLAVVPGRNNSLVQTGIFSLVRHPIYGLSIALMLCSLAVIPTVLMAGVALIHVSVLILKARSEEQHLLSAHGQSYLDYARRTGRFFPRLLPTGWRSS
jgi:protein-S-isoprenylcysteine O-methyltransferase Ste14